jgi:hypothetical protein
MTITESIENNGWSTNGHGFRVGFGDYSVKYIMELILNMSRGMNTAARNERTEGEGEDPL